MPQNLRQYSNIKIIFSRLRGFLSWMLLHSHFHKEKNLKNLLIYDFVAQPLSVGDVITFLYVAELQMKENHAVAFDITAIFDGSRLYNSKNFLEYLGSTSRLWNLTSVMPLLCSNKNVSNILILSSRDDFMSHNSVHSPYSLTNYKSVFPKISDLFTNRFLFHKIIREQILPFWERNHYLPTFSMEDSITRWARAFVQKNAPNKVACSVQLRLNSKSQSNRNSNEVVWQNFFAWALVNYPEIHFIILSSQSEYEQSSLQGANISFSKAFNTRIDEDLAIVQACQLHLGMGSGPSMMALFSNKPCCIFRGIAQDWASFTKNSDNHEFQQTIFGAGKQFVTFLPETLDRLIYSISILMLVNKQSPELSFVQTIADTNCDKIPENSLPYIR